MAPLALAARRIRTAAVRVAARRGASTAAPPVAARTGASAVSTEVSQAPVAAIETRWTRLPEAEQGAVADQLAELERGDWKRMTLDQKRAAYYIAYGAYGPRAARDPALTIKVASWVAGFLGLTGVIWAYWESVKPMPRTMTKEWKDAEDAKAIERKVNPYSGPYAQVLAKEAAENKH